MSAKLADFRWGWVCGLLAVCLAAGWPAPGRAEGLTFKDNVVVMGSDGQSALMVQSDDAVVVFSREIELPASGGFFKRARVWADRDDLRITSLNGEGLVFLGNERVGTFELPGGEVGGMLFKFSEHGHTLRLVKTGELAPAEDGGAAGCKLEATISRP
ncbi:MAG: hypothetical protein GX803_00055 [Lentisphaerae bacterium]|jgi:hypothetical protein|nr:hypothetical protein [Lentisphaerota bacterium]